MLLLLRLLLLMLLCGVVSGDLLPAEHVVATHNIDLCNIPILSAAETHLFLTDFFPHHPVILRNITNNTVFSSLSSLTALSHKYSDLLITLASASTYSYNRRVMSLSNYLDDMVSQPVSLLSHPEQLWYWFGDHEDPDKDSSATSSAIPSLSDLLRQYQLPPTVFNVSSDSDHQTHYSVLDQPQDSRYVARLSFGVGAAYSGTPPHFHSAVFAEVLHGRKRWFLYPPDHLSSSHPPAAQSIIAPDLSALQWMQQVYTKLSPPVSAHLLQCTCTAGDLLFVPDHWYHATLNTEISVFMSMFMFDKGEKFTYREEQTEVIL